MTLVEVLTGLILLGILATLLTRLMLGQARLARQFFARAAALESVTQANEWLAAELQEGGTVGGTSDLLALAPDSVVYRAWRGAGLACLVAPGEVRILRERLSLWRSPQPGRDSLALLLPTDSTGPASWVRLPVLGASVSSCGSRPALAIATSVPPVAGLSPLVPVRVYEVALVKFYRSLGEWWLGARSVSAGEGLQPVTGPWLPGGVRFRYQGRTGGPAAADSVASIELELLPPQGGGVRARIARGNLP